MKKILAVLLCGLTWSACSGKKDPPPPTPQAKLYVNGGTMTLEDSTGGTATDAIFDALVVDGSGTPLAMSYSVTLTPPGGGTAVVFQCKPDQPSCFYFDALPTTGQYTATTTVNGQTLSTQFTMAADALDPPQGSATVSGSSVTASWSPVQGAKSYLVSVVDAQGNLASTQSLSTTGTSGTVTLALGEDPNSGDLSLLLIALDLDPFGAPSVPPVAPSGSGSLSPLSASAPDPGKWTYYGPSDFSGGTLQLTFSALGPDEHVAVIAINDTSTDGANVDLSLSGTNALLRAARTSPSSAPNASRRISPTSSLAMRIALSSLASGGLVRAPRSPESGSTQSEQSWLRNLRHEAMIGHARYRARQRRRLEPALKLGRRSAPRLQGSMALAPDAIGDTRAFCVQQGLTGPSVSKTATLKASGTHVEIWVDDDDLAHYTSTELNDLVSKWENDIYPADTQTFGAESDVDSNGKLLIFFSGELGAPQNGAVLLGYYGAGDVYYPKDTTCSDPEPSNGADMFYINDIYNVDGGNPTLDGAIFAQEYPSTLAHEFQHLINFNEHFILHAGTTPEETWINEGLSKVAEDITGFGWNSDRSDLSGYLAYFGPTSYVNYTRYFNSSFPNWTGDPIGDYAGVHSFFRYFVDRLGTGILKQIDDTSEVGVAHLVGVLGEPDLPHAMADWTTALMFGNESFSPDPKFDFKAGEPWTPLFRTVSSDQRCAYDGYPGHSGYLGYQTFDASGAATATLRQDGWNAFVSGAGTGGDATLTVTAPTGELPSVVVVRFTGDLPDGSLTCP